MANEHKCLQEVNVKSYFEQEEALNGVYKFDFNQADNSLLVHVFKANFLLYFRFDEKDDKLNFIKKIDVDEPIDYFLRVFDNFYLFVYFGADSSVKFQVRKLENDSLLDLSTNDALEKKLKSIECHLLENVTFKSVVELKSDLEKDYLSFFKAKSNNMQYYYEKKHERMGLTPAKTNTSNSQKRKHSNSTSEITNETKMIK